MLANPEEKLPRMTDSAMKEQIRYFLYSNNMIEKDEIKAKQLTDTELLDKLSQKWNGIAITENNPFFMEYLIDFWDYNNGIYRKSLLADGSDLGLKYCTDNIRMLKKYIKPYFMDGRNYRIRNITTKILKDFKLTLPAELKTRTKNKIMSIMCIALERAVEDELLDNWTSPKMPAIKDVKVRGILAKEEFIKLFNTDWDDEMSRIANLLAATTGMRLGEVCALTMQDLDIENNLIQINHSWERIINDFKCPKNSEKRTVPVNAQLMQRLIRLYNDNPHEGKKFIFWSSKATAPVCTRRFLDAFREIMIKIGIPLEEQLERNLVFHSHRHFLNTYLKLAFSDADTVRLMILGHRSKQVNMVYTHDTMEMYNIVRDTIDREFLSAVKV
jgi:integrase